MTARTTAANPALETHVAFLRLLPAIEAHARSAFRALRCPHDRDDAVAEVVARSWEEFLAAPLPPAPDRLVLLATAHVREALAPAAY
jgi:hypothetical protein